MPVFQPCAAFSGRRPGAVFKAGPLGLGYYRDAAALPLVSSSKSKISLTASWRRLHKSYTVKSRSKSTRLKH